jgi:hypothetical protein
MPIRGLTRREDVTPRFTRLGKLKKGEIVNGSPVDLDYLRFVGEGANADEIERAFRDTYGPEPREINVYLPYKTLDENWQTWMEEWGKSGLIHRCDGEVMVQWLDLDKRYVTDYDQHRNQPCPYHAGQKRTKQNPGCTQVGRLAVIVPELLQAGFVGYVTLEIHSVNDLSNLTASLLDAENKSGSAQRDTGLQGILFKLRRQEEQIGVRYASKTGEIIKTRGNKWMVRIDPAREWVQHQIETVKQMALGYTVQRPALIVDAELVNVDGAADLLPIEPERVEGEIITDSPGPEFEDGSPGEPAETPKAKQVHDTRPVRPFDPWTLVTKIEESLRERRAKGDTLGPKLGNFKKAVITNLESCFDQHKDQGRHLVAEYLLGEGKGSSTTWDDVETLVLHNWLGATEQDGVWEVNPHSKQEAQAVRAEALACQGQQVLDL